MPVEGLKREKRVRGGKMLGEVCYISGRSGGLHTFGAADTIKMNGHHTHTESLLWLGHARTLIPLVARFI